VSYFFAELASLLSRAAASARNLAACSKLGWK